MQRPPELVPIPEHLRKASKNSGKLLHFGKSPKFFGHNLGEVIQQNSGKICEKIVKNQKKNQQFLFFNEKLRLENGSHENGFPPIVFLIFGIRLQNGAKGCIV